LGDADVHVVVEDGLQALLGEGVFTHIGENGSHFNHRRDFIGEMVSTSLPPVQSVVEHSQIVSEQTTSTHPHVEATWVGSDDAFRSREGACGLVHRRGDATGR